MSTNLIAVPNVSTAAPALVDDLRAPFNGEGTVLCDTHSDGDHGRTVFSACGSPAALVAALEQLAALSTDRVDVVTSTAGQHPHVGSLDVAPLVYAEDAQRGAACASALTLAHAIGELGVPVFLYGELTADEGRPERTRSQLRAGGVSRLAERITSGELTPDFGPAQIHPVAGATLVAARAPLVAFNVVLSEGDLLAARSVAAQIREGAGHRCR